MPDFHQPDRSDRAEAEKQLRDDLSEQDVAEMRRQAASRGIADADRLDRDQLIELMQASTNHPNDPAWPNAPKT